MNKKNDMVVYNGLADCHGIESFRLEGILNISMLQIRASANPQRHAVVFQVKLKKELADYILSLIDKGEFIGALTIIKRSAKKDGVKIPNSDEWINNTELSLCKPLQVSESNWNNIPNPKLDPYA